MIDYYLEFVFPEKQIRYIAVIKNEDTKKILISFLSKTYSTNGLPVIRSRKVNTALQAKFAEGQRTFAHAD